MKIFNSLTRSVEEFTHDNDTSVSIYTCGPTVYSYVTIGNYRTYILGDILKRVLEFNNFKTKYIMNLTDVGHLTGDNEGDADTGEDRIEKAVKKEGKSVKEITTFYTKDFMRGYKLLNMLEPNKFSKATEYIDEMINFVVELEDLGYTYETSDGIYFDTSKFENYGQLSGMNDENVLEGARVEVNLEKRNPTDFAVWKLSPEGVDRAQEWQSPRG